MNTPDISMEFDKLFLFDVDSFENLADSSEIDDNYDDLVLNEDEISEMIDTFNVYIFYSITGLLLWVALTHLSYNIMEYNSKPDSWFVQHLDSCDFTPLS